MRERQQDVKCDLLLNRSRDNISWHVPPSRSPPTTPYMTYTPYMRDGIDIELN